jgi:hypothetical protein
MTLQYNLKLGQVVYFKIDAEQVPYMVTGIMVRSSGLTYFVSYCGTEVVAWEYEITTEKNVLL